MKTTIQFLTRIFSRKKYQLGPQVFYSRSWLEKQVDEQMWKKAFKLE